MQHKYIPLTECLPHTYGLVLSSRYMEHVVVVKETCVYHRGLGVACTAVWEYGVWYYEVPYHRLLSNVRVSHPILIFIRQNAPVSTVKMNVRAISRFRKCQRCDSEL
jgi:hypothetical protein